MPEGFDVQLSRYRDMARLYDSKNLPSYEMRVKFIKVSLALAGTYFNEVDFSHTSEQTVMMKGGTTELKSSFRAMLPQLGCRNSVGTRLKWYT